MLEIKKAAPGEQLNQDTTDYIITRSAGAERLSLSNKNASMIPVELKKRDQWVLWRLQQRNGGKPTKIPYSANGKHADSTDPQTWTSFEYAWETYIHSNGYFNGIGYVFSPDDSFTGVDLDNCVRDGEITDDALAIVKELNSYTEYSQSKSGLHVIVKAKIHGERRRNGNYEMYDTARFFCVTGDHVLQTPETIESRQKELNAIYQRVFGEPKPEKSSSNLASNAAISDDDVVKLALNAKNGRKFSALYSGDHSDYGSPSEADMAFCNLLAFYTQDRDQIDRIFRKSGRYRRKWDRDNYRDRTIEEALAGLNEVYRGCSESAATAFNVIPLPDKQNWKNALQMTNNGAIRNNHHNVSLILQNDNKLKGLFAYNTFCKRHEVTRQPPWKREKDSNLLTDHDDAGLRMYISTNYGIAPKAIILDVVDQHALENQYHPIRDYLNRVKPTWDGEKRLDTLLIDYFGAKDTELTRMQTRLAFVGAIKRVFQPGCKMDYVLTLKGDQGLGKSTFFEILALNKEWFSDSLDDLIGKDSREHLQGKWIIELGEMAAVSKGDQKRIKQFISASKDSYRLAYGVRTADYLRQCIFVATTNDVEPLKDETGGRRWWIVDVYERWFDKKRKLHEEIDQIWAEAMHIYEQMELNYVPLKLSDWLEEQANKVQSDNTDRGMYASEIEYILQEKRYIETFFNGRKIQEPIDETCPKHIWVKVLNNSERDFNAATGRQVNSVLKRLDGWKYVGRVKFKEYGKQHVYRRAEDRLDR